MAAVGDTLERRPGVVVRPNSFELKEKFVHVDWANGSPGVARDAAGRNYVKIIGGTIAATASGRGLGHATNGGGPLRPTACRSRRRRRNGRPIGGNARALIRSLPAH